LGPTRPAARKTPPAEGSDRDDSDDFERFTDAISVSVR
jgi:hypothetical protein